MTDSGTGSVPEVVEGVPQREPAGDVPGQGAVTDPVPAVLCGEVMATCWNEPGHNGDHWNPALPATPAASETADAAWLEAVNRAAARIREANEPEGSIQLMRAFLRDELAALSRSTPTPPEPPECGAQILAAIAERQRYLGWMNATEMLSVIKGFTPTPDATEVAADIARMFPERRHDWPTPTPDATDAGSREALLASVLHEVMCDVSHHDRHPIEPPPCYRRYENIAASAEPRLRAALATPSTPTPLPALEPIEGLDVHDLLTPEQKAALDANLRDIARKQRSALAAAATMPLGSGPSTPTPAEAGGLDVERLAAALPKGVNFRVPVALPVKSALWDTIAAEVAAEYQRLSAAAD